MVCTSQRVRVSLTSISLIVKPVLSVALSLMFGNICNVLQMFGECSVFLSNVRTLGYIANWYHIVSSIDDTCLSAFAV